MKKMGEILQEMRLSKGLKQEDVGAKLDVDPETVSKWERAARLPKRGDIVRRMVELYGKTMDQLVAQMQAPPVPGNFTIPRIGSAAGGAFREYTIDQMAEEGVPGALYPYRERFPKVLRVDGASMDYAGPDAISHGDDVIFADEFEEPIADGDIVVARFKSGDESAASLTVKRVKFVDDEHYDLVPNNPRHKPMRVRKDEVILKLVQVIVNYAYKRRGL